MHSIASVLVFLIAVENKVFRVLPFLILPLIYVYLSIWVSGLRATSILGFVALLKWFMLCGLATMLAFESLLNVFYRRVIGYCFKFRKVDELALRQLNH